MKIKSLINIDVCLVSYNIKIDILIHMYHDLLKMFGEDKNTTTQDKLRLKSIKTSKFELIVKLCDNQINNYCLLKKGNQHVNKIQIKDDQEGNDFSDNVD